MGRPVKVKAEEIATENTPVLETTTEVKEVVISNTEYAKMQAELDSLKKAMQMFMSGMGNQKTSSISEEEVVFVSLYDGTLNLTTEKYGGGNVYSFTSFGEEQFIPVSEAKLLIRNHKRFAQEGFFYIMNEELVKANGLQAAYKKLLDKETMETLFNQNKSTFTKIFSEATESQKEMLSDMLLRKIINKENVDMNIVDAVEKIVGRDLSSEAETIKQVFKEDK